MPHKNFCDFFGNQSPSGVVRVIDPSPMPAWFVAMPRQRFSTQPTRAPRRGAALPWVRVHALKLWVKGLGFRV
jgi:hypothetical protein